MYKTVYIIICKIIKCNNMDKGSNTFPYVFLYK